MLNTYEQFEIKNELFYKIAVPKQLSSEKERVELTKRGSFGATLLQAQFMLNFCL